MICSVLPSGSVLSRSTSSSDKGSSSSSGVDGGSTVSVLLLLFKKPDLRESHRPAFKDQAAAAHLFACVRLWSNLGVRTSLRAPRRHAVGMQTARMEMEMEEEGVTAEAAVISLVGPGGRAIRGARRGRLTDVGHSQSVVGGGR